MACLCWAGYIDAVSHRLDRVAVSLESQRSTRRCFTPTFHFGLRVINESLQIGHRFNGGQVNVVHGVSSCGSVCSFWIRGRPYYTMRMHLGVAAASKHQRQLAFAGDRIFSATRPCGSIGIGGRESFMKFCLSSSGCETRPAKGEPARAGS